MSDILKELANKYISLHAHSTQQRDGVQTIKELIDYGLENKKTHLSLTDHGTMTGCLDFYYSCKKVGINPILGSEFYYVKDVNDKYILIPDDKKAGAFKKKVRKPYHLVLLAKNLTGYQQLIHLTNEANKHFHGKPRIDFNILNSIISKNPGNIVCLTACMKSPLYEDINHAHALHSVFKDDFYLELQYHGYNPLEELKYAQCLIELSKRNKYNLICTNDVHIAKKDDLILHQLFVAIDRKVLLDSPEAAYMQGTGYHNLSSEETLDLFKVFNDSILEECLKNVIKVQEQCMLNLPYKKGVFRFPEFSTPKGFNSNYEYLQHLVFNSSRYVAEKHEQRARHELQVYRDCGFVDYILPLEDILTDARRNGEAIGVGRGSAAGSLLNYLLNITQIDPIDYDLSFERFITAKYNSDTGLYENARLTAPDVDVDLSDNGAVFDYIKRKYGRDKVCGIGTKQIYKPKSAFRDVLMAVHKMGGDLKNSLAKHIDDSVESLKIYVNNPDLIPEPLQNYKREINLAARLEGRISTSSTHAAGAVFSDDIQNHIPLAIDKNALKKIKSADLINNKDSQAGVDGEDETVDEEILKYVSQYDKDDIKNTGFTKYDLLGLATLIVLKKCEQMTGIPWETLNPRDPKYAEVYKNIFRKKRTTGVFQVASGGMRRLLEDIEASCFEDVQAANALYRPQVLKQKLDKLFKDNKLNPSLRKKIHPLADAILDETYGVTVYQEQVLKMLTIVGKIEAFDADNFRRILSDNKTNNDPEQLKLLNNYTKQFIQGAVENGIDEEAAKEIYSELASKSGYSFNKSHSCAYAVTAFACAFYKYYYPLEFIISNASQFPDDLNSSIKETEEIIKENKIAGFEDNEGNFIGIRIKFPDINLSGYTPCVQQDEKGKYIQLGLTNILGFGDRACQELISCRPYNIESLSEIHEYIDFLNKKDSEEYKTNKEWLKANELRTTLKLGDLRKCKKNKLNSKSLKLLFDAGVFFTANKTNPIYCPNIQKQKQYYGSVLELPIDLKQCMEKSGFYSKKNVEDYPRKGAVSFTEIVIVEKIEHKKSVKGKDYKLLSVFSFDSNNSIKMTEWRKDSKFKPQFAKYSESKETLPIEEKQKYLECVSIADLDLKEGDIIIIKYVEENGFKNYASGRKLEWLVPEFKDIKEKYSLLIKK